MAAIDVADREGLDAVTMRRLGAELHVEAMSLYKHVANKDEILDGIVDLVIGQIEIPKGVGDWRAAMRRRAHSARAVLGRHPWAIGLMESRGVTGPSALRYVDAVLGILRSAGFSVEDAAHVFWTIDSFVYGHVVQENSMRIDGPEEAAERDAALAEEAGMQEYPHLAEVAGHAQGGVFTFDGEFSFGLELILDGSAAALD